VVVLGASHRACERIEIETTLRFVASMKRLNWILLAIGALSCTITILGGPHGKGKIKDPE